MKLIVGLGNPGIQYEKTRHNFGWRAVDVLAREMEASSWKIDLRFNAFVAECFLNGEKIIFAKPQTFMNNSGIAVKSIADYYKILTEEILIIHDEIDLPLGEAKIQKNRGAAGHNGIKSVIEKLKSKDFIRMRLGIKSDEQKNLKTEEFVLQNFTDKEEKIVQKTIKKAIQIIRTAF
ncbi:aminoacyl-tRNA hydrolase [Patescibacteria group bacterium]|nr:aminoacyl-tRNA hydrolase [Patescibacteria group bacterium]MBU4030697.1 aminoacyl-tRNA hydrolase [Patescibacteria group bacterium]MBU4082527.1 aminoacyl-tRNA hydrolase [Patescibacteria group bacterium]MCG2809331.1 aminoacyl-tRNA hydrolase [Candidatus Portnoybacteria bacterium]